MEELNNAKQSVILSADDKLKSQQKGSERNLGRVRDYTIDTIKGIGIILMVAVHGGAPFSHFINLFHMPIFFIASGYFWNNKNLENFDSLKKFIFRKMQTLWLPFVLYNSVLIALNNFFLRIGFYTSNVEFLSLTGESSNAICSIMSLKEIVLASAKTAAFAGKSRLASPTWFLGSLFMVTVTHALVEFVALKIRKVRLAYAILVLGMAAGATVVSVCGISLPNSAHTVFAGSLAYYMGIAIRRWNMMDKVTKYKWYLLGGSAVGLVILNQFGTIAMWSGSITNILYFAVVSLLGWTLLWSIAKITNQPLCKCFAYLGSHSMWVLLLHIVCFKLVTFVYLMLSGGNMLLLASIPRLDSVPNYLWVFYSVVGLGIPLLMEQGWIHLKKVGKHQ